MNRTRIFVAAAALFAALTALAAAPPPTPVPNPLPYPGQFTTGPNAPLAPLDTPLVSSTQPQFVNPLPLPVDFTPDKTTYPGWDYYEIQMREVTGLTVPGAIVWGGGPAGTEWLGLVDLTAGFCGATTTPCNAANALAVCGAAACTPNVTSPLYKSYTPVWGYGQLSAGGGPLTTALGAPIGAATYPAMNIRGTKNIPVKVKWVNGLQSNTHLFCPQPLNANWPCAIDRTLMGTLWNANGTGLAPNGLVNQYGSPQQADNAMVVHLHGGEIPPNSDGFAELWFGNATTSAYYSQGTAQPIDPVLSYKSGGNLAALNLKRPIGNSMLYNYPMKNEAATIWYHDHALGKTRINVAAGPAGFFPVNDPVAEKAIWNPTNLPGVSGVPTEPGYVWAKDTPGLLGCSPGGILAGNCYDLNIVFQDRDFNAPTAAEPNLARINYPNGMNWPVAAPLVPNQTPLTPGGNADLHPQWVPEYFGTFPIVNGMAWPFMNVEPRKYRFHFLDGSNARCWSLKRSDGLPMTVIGDDQGYLGVAAPTFKLLMCPGERYDLIMDFTGLLPGTLITLINDAPAPFPKGISPGPGDVKKPLQFKVVPLKNADVAPMPTLTAITPLPTTATQSCDVATPGTSCIRELVLNEQLDPLTLYPKRVQIDGKSFEDAITETPKRGTIEVWKIINTTGDVHPMHLHLVKYQIVSRQTFDLNGYSAATNFAIPMAGYTKNCDSNGNVQPCYTKLPITPYLKGKPVPPAPYEAGWKDAALSYPGEVLTIVAKWDASWNESTPDACTVTSVTDPVTLVTTYTQTCPQGDALPTTSTTPPVAQPAFMPVTSGPYVWHCHIVDHEDNEMMRPVVVQ